MNPFNYVSINEVTAAIVDRNDHPKSSYLAGGTNLVDHIKLGVEQPDRLIDVRKLKLGAIETLPSGALRIGATVSNTDLAYDERVRKQYPALSQAILSGASPQLRNVATTAGNLLQRTRCYYFRDVASPCNKRQPGSGCAALGGVNRMHAILGTSDKCIATHPSDMDVAMVAFEAVVRTQGAKGERVIPIGEFYVPYGEDPAKENVLEPGELIIGVDLPKQSWFTRSYYFKARDRASFEFSLSSAAVALDLDGDKIRDCRIALGGVATKPWRASAAENALRGAQIGEDAFRSAAEAELKPAIPQTYNSFKIELCKRVLVQSLKSAAALAI